MKKQYKKKKNNKKNNKNNKNSFLYKTIYIKNNNYEFNFKIPKHKISTINPLIEIKRYTIFNNIKTDFLNILLENIKPNNIRNNTKNLKQLTTETLIRFIFLGIFYNKNTFDPLFPYNFDNYTQVIKDINNIILIENDNLLTNKIISELNLKNRFNQANIELYNYIKKTKFNLIKFDITKYIKHNIEYEKIAYGDYFIILNSFVKQKLVDKYIYFKNIKLNNEYINNLELISENSIYNTFLNHIWCVMFRYFIINDNNQLILNIHEELDTYYNNNFELFASSINSYKNYCSLFYDIEKNFGSYGNFFNINIISGFYKANMPYDEEIMKLSCNKLVTMLKKSNKPLACLLCMPVWDYEGKKKLTNKKIENHYGKYDALDILMESNLITYKKIISKKNINYLSINNMKKISATNTYIIIIENSYSNIDLSFLSKFSFL